jgi:hypothetical protein
MIQAPAFMYKCFLLKLLFILNLEVKLNYTYQLIALLLEAKNAVLFRIFHLQS